MREDYSPDDRAWDYFSHDHARSRAYRWNEDGLGGLCDDQQRLCCALTLWNGKDPYLKGTKRGQTTFSVLSPCSKPATVLALRHPPSSAAARMNPSTLVNNRAGDVRTHQGRMVMDLLSRWPIGGSVYG